MSYKELKCIDILLKLISDDLKLDFSYKLICKWNNQFVTLDLTLPLHLNGEFYLSEPKTISSIFDNKEMLYTEVSSKYNAFKEKFKFNQLLNYYKNKETNYLMIYLLENNYFYNFDIDCSDYAYNIVSLDKSWNIPIVKIDNDLEFISFQLVKHGQN
ncbi:hypothetical protein [Staphylococcus simiae]|uniref:Uncharacterized protein n=1 Tax=Staphylococcus simiae CCM 7213 = CCUG 51256 TaxID=911238 RepID=G5JJV1_9STAP|nr:hypothetical protein [Staphylococcus simiae]EHJ07506.1 hypothetical protein SS7213T_08802 [Staphylococcus simiae CCM 7213 = CCUG 51256]PNZ09838.1 hypothetical protein CD113_11425 [Staphylococcus simiae]SNV75512.1 Uncharacterised protein [Staphylococcus simiae]